MKTQPNYPRRERNTLELLFNLVIAILLFVLIMVATSCGGTFTLSPTGVVTYTQN